MKRDSYYRAVKELEDKGYLQETAGGRFIFREVREQQEAAGAALAGGPEDLPRTAAEAVREAAGGGSGFPVIGQQGTKCAGGFAKAESFSDGAIKQGQKQERNITDNTHTDNDKGKQEAQEAERGEDREDRGQQERQEQQREALEVCGTIPAHIYESLLEPVIDMGGGLVRLHNGKVYRLEQGQRFHQPRAAEMERKK